MAGKTWLMAKRPIRRKARRAAAGPSAPRTLHTRLKTARGRTVSSSRWLERQLNDPYVAEARRLGFRSRSAFKLIELDEQYHLLKKNAVIVDLGAAPGGWAQVAVDRVGSGGTVVGIDLQEIDPIPGARFEVMDFLDADAPDRLRAILGGPVDLVMSDMAAASTGHKATDHIKIMALCEIALEFSIQVLKPGGNLVAKVLKGGAENDLLQLMRQRFVKVHHAKPKASRRESAEAYVLALGFRKDGFKGGDPDDGEP